MSWIKTIVSRFAALFQKCQLDKEMDEELRFHLEMETEANLRRGMSPQGARRAARLSFGGVEQVKEAYRDRRGIPFLETLVQDVRYGARMLARNPGFTAVAVLTLALGIGANTAIFSVVSGILLRPLPYKDGDRIVTLWQEDSARAQEMTQRLGILPYRHRSGRWSFPGRAYLEMQVQIQAFEQMGAWGVFIKGLILTVDGEPQEVRAVRTSASLFPLLGVEPLLGRTFVEEEDRFGAANVVLLGHGIWQSRYGSHPAIVGKTIALSGDGYTVIGVLPPGFRLPAAEGLAADVWVPLALGEMSCELRYSCSNFRVLAKLAPGVTEQRALEELEAYASRAWEQGLRRKPGQSMTLLSLHRYLVGDIKKPFFVLLGAVGLVLLMACANVANLLLMRAAARRRELAIRSALGAGRLRITRQLLSESTLIWLLGGIVGVLFAFWAMDALLALLPQDFPRREAIGIDWRVLSFAVLLTLVTATLFGLIPALSASRPDLNECLKESGARLGLGSRSRRLQRILVVVEVALAMVLLAGAGLLVNTFRNLRAVRLGFAPEKLLTARISLPEYKYADRDLRANFFRQLIEKVENIPGVIYAGAAYPLPFSGVSRINKFWIDQDHEYEVWTHRFVVTQGYFRVMGIPLLKGRWFTDRDVSQERRRFSEGNSTDAPGALIINETMARRCWPGEDPIGKLVDSGNEMGRPPREVVGVVGDIRNTSFTQEPVPQIYTPFFPWLRSWRSTMILLVRTHGDPLSFVPALRTQLQILDRNQPLGDVRTMEQLLSDSAAPWRFNMLLLGFFALSSVALAAVGIYGVISYSVSQRTHEIGIRTALGAQPSDVIRLVIGQGMKLALAGVATGVCGALALTRLISGFLYNVSPTDPVTFVAVSLLLTGVALLACYIPARRATKVDPMVALRYE